MSTSQIDLHQATARAIAVSDDALSVDLADGRTITVPLVWFPRLARGTAAERSNWRLIGGGEGDSYSLKPAPASDPRRAALCGLFQPVPEPPATAFPATLKCYRA